jgi:hypothetical protein
MLVVFLRVSRVFDGFRYSSGSRQRGEKIRRRTRKERRTSESEGERGGITRVMWSGEEDGKSGGKEDKRQGERSDGGGAKRKMDFWSFFVDWMFVVKRGWFEGVDLSHVCTCSYVSPA